MIGVIVCGNIIPFTYHVLGTNTIIKGFMQYVVVVCFHKGRVSCCHNIRRGIKKRVCR